MAQATGSKPSQISVVFSFIYSMLISSLLLNNPVIGCAIFLCGRLSVFLMGSFSADSLKLLRRPLRLFCWLLSFLLLLCNLLLIAYDPSQENSALKWLVFALIASLMLVEIVGRRLIRHSLLAHWTSRRFFFLYFAALLLLAAGGVVVLLSVSQPENVYLMLGGYLLQLAFTAYEQIKYRAQHSVVMPPEPEQLESDFRILGKSHPYLTFGIMRGWILIAMELTIVLVFTYLAVTAERLLISTAIVLGISVTVTELSEFATRHLSQKRIMDPINITALGLFLWFYGLKTAYDLMKVAGGDPGNIYTPVVICSLGISLCLQSLNRMEKVVLAAGEFYARESLQGVDWARESELELITFLAQLVALTAFTGYLLYTRFQSGGGQLAAGAALRPTMALPALILVVAAFLASMRYPFTQRYSQKLDWAMQLRSEGSENPALESQLMSVMEGRRSRPIGTHVVMAFLRPLFRHQLKGADHIRPDADNPLIFLCNHGSVYGPVVGMLYIPVPIRPWVISEIVTTREEMAEYVYRYTVSTWRWCPERLKRFICWRILAPLSLWGMNQLEAIPVYRNKPTMLMKTMRLSVEALQSGDNLLIFPENPNALQEEKGYETEGIGPLFSGFAMIAQVYWNKTGKRCRFMPMYCHKKSRTMTFGEEILYNPEADPNEERERISQEAWNQMNAILQEEERAWQEAHPRSQR